MAGVHLPSQGNCCWSSQESECYGCLWWQNRRQPSQLLLQSTGRRPERQLELAPAHAGSGCISCNVGGAREFNKGMSNLASDVYVLLWVWGTARWLPSQPAMWGCYRTVWSSCLGYNFSLHGSTLVLSASPARLTLYTPLLRLWTPKWLTLNCCQLTQSFFKSSPKQSL